SELDAIQVEATKIINVAQFVDAAEVDQFYFDTPYYMSPDGVMAEETYRVIRTAMEDTGTVGLGSLVLSSRERRVLLAPKGRGIALTTLRTGKEVRSAEAYYEGVGDGVVENELLDMAKMLIQARKQPFQPSELVDQYEEAVRQLVMAKAKGETPVYAQIGQPTAVVDLMQALKESLAKEGSPARKPAARGKRAAAAEPAATAPAKPARRKKAS
ncbi:MAG: Ku protein, partial [Pseudomonadota bacterium]|nr:Ku protein [Pseudomonadota bacterium]